MRVTRHRRRAHFPLDLPQQVENLRLHGHVERRGRLVGEEHRGLPASAAAMTAR
ncbi:MAG: hypothetical protein V8T01_05375 [Oscillospiraceae bacterium]